MMEYVLICFCTLYVEVYLRLLGLTVDAGKSFRTLNVEVYLSITNSARSTQHCFRTLNVEVYLDKYIDVYVFHLKFPYIKC